MITIVDYDAGNLKSVVRACDAVGTASLISSDPDVVAEAERVIFPGVGAAPSAMATLQKRGLGQALRVAFDKGTPILGICLGTQIVLEHSEEGSVDCLGLVPGRTRKFALENPALKIPHMGWNAVSVQKPHPLLEGLEEGTEFYFVHSFFPSPALEEYVYATTEYETPFCSALGHKNLFATQFHPEKSGRFGLDILKRFAQWDGGLC